MAQASYHYGVTIKEFREQRDMTQAKLAEVWPKSNGDVGVNVRYVQDIEYGRKHIEDSYTLRKLCDLLSIPYWRVGLSEHDPFNPQSLPGHGKSMYNETLDTAECLIRDAWHLRRAAPLPTTEKTVERLNALFEYFRVHVPPPLRLEERFLLLYAQLQRLNAVMNVERQRYKEALTAFERMYKTAEESGNPATIATALMGMGTELERADRQEEAVDRLEQARDASFGASKQMAALIHAYLARAYSGNGDALRFNRAIDTAQRIASDLKENYGDGTDFVFHAMSGILAERSYGYLDIGEPQKTIDMKDEITHQIMLEGNKYLDAWIPLDWARAYQMLNEIEKSVEEALLFFHRASALQSPHAKSRAYRHLKALDEAGYRDVQAVKDFRAELQQVQPLQHKGNHQPLSKKG